MDAGGSHAINEAPHNVPKLDAINEYQTSPLFSDQERAALDFATEPTEQEHVSPDTFVALSRHYSEREICEIETLIGPDGSMSPTSTALDSW
jgi:alkylhydroperoxidase family enzyme